MDGRLCLHRRHALDLDQHLRIGQRHHDASGACGIGRGAERAGIERVHRGDVTGAGQQHVDFDEIAELDINPLLVREEGKGAVAVDMRLILK